MRRKTGAPALFCVLAATLVAVAGCGSSNDNKSSSSTTNTSTAATNTTTTPSSGKGSTLKLAADPSGALKFDKPKLTAKAGLVTIKMDDPSPVQHAVAVEGNGVDKKGQTVTQGGVSTVSANLKAGTYEFYCPVDGHKQAGMKGTLTVK